MSLIRIIRSSSPLALSLRLVACGESNSVGIPDNMPEPATGAANGSEEIDSLNAVSSVTGRVADGYISGATICVDLNENDSCDTDEPSAVSGVGGTYELELPAGAENKPIVADIPAEAIDEDTGEPVGQALVFIAPADKPEFLSPITTLVHQELQANPALSVDDAEKAVKTILGIDEDDVSLFTDYVANGSDAENTGGNVESFRYLHDTARVVASLMKDIETQVESAAVSKGVDVIGDADTQRAIRDIVRNEVRDLLPQIARQVAQIVNTSDNTLNGDVENQAGRADFDPQALATSLRPTDATDNVQERIAAARDIAQTVDSDLRQLLTDGVYWMEFDCHFEHDDRFPEDSVVELNVEPLADQSIDSSGESVPNYPMPVCDALYGHVQLDTEGQALVSEQYRYQKATGGWEIASEEQETGLSDFVLVNGQWVMVSSEGPEGQVRFADDGSAVVTNDQGTMQLNAVTQVLDGTKVVHHLLEDAADPIWLEITDPADLFPSGALTHKISVREVHHPYVMFNHPPYGDLHQEQCVEFNSNCNVVEVQGADDQSYTLTSLQELRELSLSGVYLQARVAGFGGDAMMEFKSQSPTDGGLPTFGDVQWIFNEHNSADKPVDYVDTGFEHEQEYSPETGVYPKELEACKIALEGGEYEADLAVKDNGVITEPQDALSLADVEYCLNLLAQAGLAQDPVDIDTEDPFNVEELKQPQGYDENLELLSSRWELIEVQGVKMIEIKLPLRLRHDSNVDTEEAILLIAHEELVRMGVRLPETYIDRVFTYNENAFTALRSIVETGFSGEQSLIE